MAINIGVLAHRPQDAGSAFDSPLVRWIFAETAVYNLPSQRVLENNLFLRTGIRDTADDGPVVQWQLNRVR
jgi:RimJ/RimL family protein N-acetyltransferase